eukprot:TRINITY_DN175_c0_g1_i1.p1 TRINITY_DN175_c0_g1~~TRINITY_DN175_c0_g1_i1.p1  ORF type:complete len:499 (-),score=116.39 TRINITY_DN175_c0_g1_i1:1496-2992(-)
MWELLKELPMTHKRLLRRLVEFLLEVAKYSEENKMTTSSLAIVFAPNLLRPKNADTLQFISDARYINSIIRSILDQYELLSDALYDGENNSETDGLVPPQPPKRRLWRKKGLEPVPPQALDSDSTDNKIAPLNLSPTTDTRFSVSRKANRVSSSGSLVDRRMSRPGDFTTRIFQDLASSGGIVIQIEEPVHGVHGDPTLAPHYSFDITTGIGVGLRYNPEKDRGINAPPKADLTPPEKRTCDNESNKSVPTTQQTTSTVPIQSSISPLNPEPETPKANQPSSPPPLPPKPLLIEIKPEGCIEEKPKTPVQETPTEKDNTKSESTLTDDERHALIHTPVSNSEDKADCALMLTDPHTFISNKLTEDQNKKNRPESIKAMSLAEMKDEKDLLKKLLHDYNYAIEKQYSRLPSRDDKEPLRQLYRRYRMLKRRIELFSTDSKQERTRSVSSVTYLKEEEKEIQKRIEQYKDDPEAQHLLQLETAKLKTIQRLILEWDARVG